MPEQLAEIEKPTMNEIHEESDADNRETAQSWIPLPTAVGGPDVQVVVGDKTFSVPEDLICRHSTYFKAALQGGFEEAHTKEVKLDDRLDLFQVFRLWLHKENFDFLNLEERISNEELRLRACIELYGFADRRGVPAMGDHFLQMMDKIIRPDGLPVRLTVDTICRAYMELPETSGLCKYLVAVEHDANRCHLEKRLAGDYRNLPGSFTAALLELTGELRDVNHEATVLRQSVNIADLETLVKKAGGYVMIDADNKWELICQQLGFQVDAEQTRKRMYGQVKALYLKYMGPWALGGGRESHQSGIRSECPRPFVEEYLANALPALKNKARFAPRTKP